MAALWRLEIREEPVFSPAITAWLQFVVCAVLIGYTGTKLSRYGDIIAEKTGLGGAWIGLALMATVTSLPELVTGISSVTLADAPDIAVGNVLGACVMNLAMIVILACCTGANRSTRVPARDTSCRPVSASS